MIPLTLFLSLSTVLAAPSAPHIKRQAAPTSVPAFVTAYAPILHLYSSDCYRPTDIGAQLTHTRPELNFTIIPSAPQPLTLNNLNALNALGGSAVYLTAMDGVTKTPQPSWVFGVTPDTQGRTEGAVSCAVVVNDHGGGLVDVFYM